MFENNLAQKRFCLLFKNLNHSYEKSNLFRNNFDWFGLISTVNNNIITYHFVMDEKNSNNKIIQKTLKFQNLLLSWGTFASNIIKCIPFPILNCDGTNVVCSSLDLLSTWLDLWIRLYILRPIQVLWNRVKNEKQKIIGQFFF